MDTFRTTRRAALCAVLALLVGLVTPAAVDWATNPYAPAPMTNPGLWTVGVWEGWTDAQRNNFVVGYWTGLYTTKVLLDEPGTDWTRFMGWLNFETAKDTEAMKLQVKAWGQANGRGALLLDAWTAEGLARNPLK